MGLFQRSLRDGALPGMLILTGRAPMPRKAISNNRARRLPNLLGLHQAKVSVGRDRDMHWSPLTAAQNNRRTPGLLPVRWGFFRVTRQDSSRIVSFVTVDSGSF